MRALASLCLLTGLAVPAASTTYQVGPGQPLAAIGDVPWESLLPGDNVLIHWRATPYREKWVIGRAGRADAPITVRGVPGPGGERPVISGDGATTRAALDFWNEERGLIKIGGSSVPPETRPEWIVIEGLELRSAHPDYSFSDDRGATQTYRSNAAAVYVEYGRNLVVRDCELHDSGNGLFIGSPDGDPTTGVLIERNSIHGNGNVGSVFEHNSYTTALDIVFQENHYGALRPGADGNNLKDRSAGLVVRYNWLVDGNRQLDLVNANLGSQIEQHPSYRTTHVYGNVLVEPEGAGNRQMVHYGGDSGSEAEYRKGTLLFYNNTLISERAGFSTLFRLSSNEERCDARNNVVYLPNAGGAELELVSDAGTLDWTHNWLAPGWSFSHFGTAGTFNDAGTSVEGSEPGFVDAAARDYRLRADAQARDAGTSLHPAALPAHDVSLEPRFPRASAPRPVNGLIDIGAHEFADARLPAEVRPLLLIKPAHLSWTAPADATSYDVLRGDIELLSGGLGAAVSECLASDLAAVELDDTTPAPSSGAVWYLVRARSASGAGTWGASRDAELASACP